MSLKLIRPMHGALLCRTPCCRASVYLLAQFLLVYTATANGQEIPIYHRSLHKIGHSSIEGGNIQDSTASKSHIGAPAALSHARSPAEAGWRSTAAKIMQGGLQQLRRSGPTAVPAAAAPGQQRSKSPRVDCSKHPGLCQPGSCQVWRPEVRNK